MEVEDIDLVGLQFAQGPFHVLPEDTGLVVARGLGVPFGCQRQTPFPPFCLSGERLLLTIQVSPGSINLIEALLLKVIQALVERRQTGTLGLGSFGTKSQQPQDHPGREALCDQRHPGNK